MFFPAEEAINCSEQPVVGWYSIASHLQKVGRDLEFTYLDAEELFKRNYLEWGIYFPDEGFVIDCKGFIDWLSENKFALVQYKGTGERGRTREQLDSYLTAQRL